MKKLPFLFVMVLCIFAGCSEDEMDNLNNNNNNNTNNNNNNNNTNNNNNNFTQCSGSSMSVTLNGSGSTPSNFNNTLLHTSQGGLGVRRLDLRTIVSNGILVLSISNWDWQNPPDDGVKEKRYSTLFFGGAGTECTTIDGVDVCDEALVTYIVTGSTYYSSDEEFDGFISITDCDPVNKKVSGSFDAKIADFNEDTLEISGSFSNLCYTVLN